MITTFPGEPVATPWQPRPLARVVADLLDATGATGQQRPVIAIDGRSAGGKSTFAAGVAAAIRGAAVVHTDDVAWWESFFEWDHLLATGVLEPFRRGDVVHYRPPAWDRRDRPGAIEVPADASVLVVEGVGASRRALLPQVDVAVWVQSDAAEARRRGIERDGGSPADVEFWDEWDRAEIPFLAADRPWERAALVVCGTPARTGVPHDPATEVLVGRLLRQPSPPDRQP